MSRGLGAWLVFRSRKTGACRARIQGLRVEHRHRQSVVDEVAGRCSLDLLCGDCLEPLRKAIGVAEGESASLQFAELERLREKRVALVDELGEQLDPCPVQLLGSDAGGGDAGD